MDCHRLGHEVPITSMDNCGNILWVKHDEIQTVTLESQSVDSYGEVADGETLDLTVKELGTCDLDPQNLKHSPNGQLVVVYGDGKFFIYNILEWEIVYSGFALEVDWSTEGNFAARRSTSKISIFSKEDTNFQERITLRPEFCVERIYGGFLLAVCSNNVLRFYDWAECRFIASIDVVVKNIYWAESGNLVTISRDSSSVIFKYNAHLVSTYFDNGGCLKEGVPGAFEELYDVDETARTGLWAGDYFIYIDSKWRMSCCKGGKVQTLFYLDPCMYLLGADQSRAYVIDKKFNVIRYEWLQCLTEGRPDIYDDLDQGLAIEDGHFLDLSPIVPETIFDIVSEDAVFNSIGNGTKKLPRNNLSRFQQREMGCGKYSPLECSLLRSLPTSHATARVVHDTGSVIKNSQYSVDGSLFIVACPEERLVRFFDDEWNFMKDIVTLEVRDVALSPDNGWLVYSSVRAQPTLVRVSGGLNEMMVGPEVGPDDAKESMCVKISADGREIMTTSIGYDDDLHSISIFDITTNRLRWEMPYQASAVCFADESGDIVYAGCDDALCKVFDTRSNRVRPVGILVGHWSYIAAVDSRGDGRYFISNSQDCSLKLWDTRRMSDNVDFVPDYSYDSIVLRYKRHYENLRHPRDGSVATYKGHFVNRRVARCYFSPMFSTAQKFIYTGSFDGRVVIYDVASSDIVADLSHPPFSYGLGIPDLSWHPFFPVLVRSSLDGTIVKWEGGSESETPSE